MKQLVVFPYFSEQEIARYCRIAEFYAATMRSDVSVEFLLARRSFVRDAPELVGLLKRIAPVRQFQSLSTERSYPAGPTLFFWEIMDYIAGIYEDDGGFVLWHESDMVAVRPDWLERLDREWRCYTGKLVMGIYESGYYLWMDNSFMKPHVNGGACYSKRLSRCIGEEFRKGFFDISMFDAIKNRKYVNSRQFVFSAIHNILSHIRNRNVTIMHGVAQPKDDFIDAVVKIVQADSEVEKRRLAKSKQNGPCCRFCVKVAGVQFCPIHVNSSFEKNLYRLAGRIIQALVWMKKVIKRVENK
jgi:hypothetical protein